MISALFWTSLTLQRSKIKFFKVTDTLYLHTFSHRCKQRNLSTQHQSKKIIRNASIATYQPDWLDLLKQRSPTFAAWQLGWGEELGHTSGRPVRMHTQLNYKWGYMCMRAGPPLVLVKLQVSACAGP